MLKRCLALIQLHKGNTEVTKLHIYSIYNRLFVEWFYSKRNLIEHSKYILASFIFMEGWKQKVHQQKRVYKRKGYFFLKSLKPQLQRPRTLPSYFDIRHEIVKYTIIQSCMTTLNLFRTLIEWSLGVFYFLIEWVILFNIIGNV